MIQCLKIIFTILLSVLLISSCATKKEILYFSDIDLKEENNTTFEDGKIQSNDILSIIISSSSPDLATIYNLNNPVSTPTNGYLVTQEGAIVIPVLGKIKVKDLTLPELENLLIQKLVQGKHLENPNVTVRLTNAKFTVLGEVKNPGTYIFNEQRISLLQALGYAGDLTIYGKRQNVLIIREENNKRTYTTIDLTSKKWFDSPNYYIKPNDIIYVNPNGPKVATSGYVSNLGNVLGIISILITTIFIITN